MLQDIIQIQFRSRHTCCWHCQRFGDRGWYTYTLHFASCGRDTRCGTQCVSPDPPSPRRPLSPQPHTYTCTQNLVCYDIWLRVSASVNSVIRSKSHARTHRRSIMGNTQGYSYEPTTYIAVVGDCVYVCSATCNVRHLHT